MSYEFHVSSLAKTVYVDAERLWAKHINENVKHILSYIYRKQVYTVTLYYVPVIYIRQCVEVQKSKKISMNRLLQFNICVTSPYFNLIIFNKLNLPKTEDTRS